MGSGMGVDFIWGEVKALDAAQKSASIQRIYTAEPEDINFAYCIVCTGTSFRDASWVPAATEGLRIGNHFDERFLQGRRQHIMQEYHQITELNRSQSSVLVVGAGYIGIEWVTELQYFFSDLDLTIIDFFSRCLGPLPESAAKYCSEYLKRVGIKEFYNIKYDASRADMWNKIELPGKAAQTYITTGIKASTPFMPKCVLSERGPGGGGWIHFNKYLQVVMKPTEGGSVWGDGSVFAVGDCNYGCIGEKPFELPPLPK